MVMAEAKRELAAAMNLSVEEVDRKLVDSNRDRWESNQQVLSESLEVLGKPYDPGFLLGQVEVQLRARSARRYRLDSSRGTNISHWIRESPHRLVPADAGQAISNFLRRPFADRFDRANGNASSVSTTMRGAVVNRMIWR